MLNKIKMVINQKDKKNIYHVILNCFKYLKNELSICLIIMLKLYLNLILKQPKVQVLK